MSYRNTLIVLILNGWKILHWLIDRNLSSLLILFLLHFVII